MPYIITERIDDGCYHERSRAVATLDEAKTHAYQVAVAACPAMIGQPEYEALPITHHHRIDNLPEVGGTVGPLPDGTVIEVAPIDWAPLTSAAGLEPHSWRRREDIIDAYNVAQEVTR